ncbi:MAG TPA: serine hydrolase [Puia sp.]|nr:serine hydrolase [Puia sp.]
MSAAGQQRSDPFLDSLLRSKASPALLRVLDHPDSFHYQLIYTRIDRDRHNRPHFHNYYLRVNALGYFNPASTVKMPLSFLALEKMDSLSRFGVDRDTPMLTDSAWTGQSTAYTDTSAADGLPSLGQYIRKIFLVSDNDAYNRLYEFLGQEEINRRLHAMGYPDIRITRRFVPMTEEDNRHTNPIRFVRDGRTLYEQPAAVSHFAFDFSHPVFYGKGHLDSHDSLIHAPMDFTRHNNFPVADAQRMLQSVLFPRSVPPACRFHLSRDNYRFLYRCMSEYPRESDHPRYDTSEYFDGYTKFFFFHSGRTPIPSYIRVFNKPGWSYGFLTDIAYIVDFKHRVEFMLTGTIYTNSDGILNDDKYDYDEIGYPFFREVGSIVYRYELGRARRYRPDLSEFELSYGPGR